MRINRTYVPWAMAAGRAALGPVLAVGAACQWNGLALAGIVLTALLSDIFDGVLARRWECDSAGVRLFDSMADTFFYGWSALALWLVAPAVWRENTGLLAAVLGLEALRLGLDFAKFGKPASYHSWMAKTWGLVLASAVIAVFALGRTNGLVPVALWLGVACGLEGMTMSLMLPEWRRDVKTLVVAWRLRGEKGAVHSDRLCWIAPVVLGLFLMTKSSFAVEGNEVSYVGGTGSLAAGTLGTLDTTSPVTLVFRVKTTGAQIAIPYTQINCFAYETQVTHHLGALAAVGVSLVRRREHSHFVTLDYTDDAEKKQVMVLEVAKGLPRTLLPVLSAKVPQRCKSLPELH